MKEKYYIRELASKTEREQYFNLSQKIGNVFSSERWLNIHSDYVTLIGIFDPNDSIIGGFNLVKKKKYFVTAIRKAPFSPYNGLFFINPGVSIVSENSFNKKIFNLLADYLKSLNPDSLTFHLEPQFIDMQAMIWRGFNVTPNYTYNINLDQSEAEIIKNFHTHRRNEITGSSKKGIICIECNDKILIKNHAYRLLDRKRILEDKSIIDHIIFDFCDESNSFAFISDIAGTPVAFSLCIHDAKTAYLILNSNNDLKRDLNAGTLCVYNSILFAKKLGLKNFDFEGSMLKGVELFFRKFGGSLTPYYVVSMEGILFKLSKLLVGKNR